MRIEITLSFEELKMGRLFLSKIHATRLLEQWKQVERFSHTRYGWSKARKVAWIKPDFVICNDGNQSIRNTVYGSKPWIAWMTLCSWFRSKKYKGISL